MAPHSPRPSTPLRGRRSTNNRQHTSQILLSLSGEPVCPSWRDGMPAALVPEVPAHHDVVAKSAGARNTDVVGALAPYGPAGAGSGYVTFSIKIGTGGGLPKATRLHRLLKTIIRASLH